MRFSVLGRIEKEHWHQMRYNGLREVMVGFSETLETCTHKKKNLQCFRNTVIEEGVKCTSQVFDNIR